MSCLLMHNAAKCSPGTPCARRQRHGTFPQPLCKQLAQSPYTRVIKVNCHTLVWALSETNEITRARNKQPRTQSCTRCTQIPTGL